MRSYRVRLLGLLPLTAVVLLAASLAGHAQAQDSAAPYPRQPIRLIIGFAAGGGNDVQARIIAQKLTDRLGQPVVVQNRPGAGGNIAAEHVARAPADGYTLLFAPAATLVFNPAVYTKLPYDPVASFTPVVHVSSFPLFLTVNAQAPIKSVAELVAWAKANPGKANYGSAAATFRLATELFNINEGTAFEHIPFKSTTESLTALLNGQVSMVFADPGPLMPHATAGRVRVLAVTGDRRWPALPEVPTMTEAGAQAVGSGSFMGVVAPRATSAAVVSRLQNEIIAVLKEPDVQARFKGLGVTIVGASSAEFAGLIAREIPRWKGVADKANIKLD
jgi:tripartite-type tricarboxylate transporter receptor subunit TctC